MCLSDGTPIAIISTRAKDGTWVRTGWLNLATAGFTAGAPPRSAKPCNPNDNGGGDEPATLAGVHVEDWCDVDDDGNVLSPVLAKYTVDDAGAIVGVEFLTPEGEPYEVQGTLGICNTEGPADLTGRELVRLCDVADDGTITVFVRDYERDSTGAVVGFTDYDIDGQPYTPSGEVTSCDAAQTEEECASPTTPLATTGLCLADGTPIATVATRDCDGVVSTDGWINLLTNTYTAGQPPAGARACGETSAFDVSGVLCDVNADGDVLGLVLIEVERGADGEITGTRLINAADGSAYELQGELTVCPAGVDQPEKDLIELCDLTDDGEGTTATRFLRDYTRDENGAIVGYTDYTLDGQPYTPTGEVASCDDIPEQIAQPERDLIRLCDTVDEGEDTTVTVFVRDYERDDTGAIVSYSDYDLDGQPYTPVGEIGACEEALEAPTREHDLVRLCDTVDAGEDVETVEFIRDYERDTNGSIVGYSDYTLDGQPYEPQGDVASCDTQDACQDCETLVLCDVQPGEQQPTEFAAVPMDQLPPSGRFGDGNPVSGTLDNGVGYTVNVGEWISPQNHYTFYPSDNPQTWTFDQPVFVRFGLRGLNITPTECYVLPEGVEVESISPNHTWDEASRTLCDSGSSGATDESYFITTSPVTELPLRASGSSTGGRGPGLIEASIPTDPATSGEQVAFLRRFCRDCDGVTTSVTDTELDGTTPYTPVGEVQQCGTTSSDNEGEPVPEIDAAPIVLCDTVDGGEGEGEGEPGTVEFLRFFRVDNSTGEVTGHTDTELDGVTPYEPVGAVGVCSSTDSREQEPQDRFEVEGVPLCVLDADGEVVRHVRVEHVYDTATGERVETRNVDPVSGEPVELADTETIGECIDPCRDTQTMLLCDLADDGEVTASTTDVTPPPYSDSHAPLPGGGGALWSGGTLQFPAEPDASAGDGAQIYRTVAGQITAAPECGDTGRVTVSVRVRNDGPGDGLGTSGGLRLYRGDTIIAQAGVPMDAPVGYVDTLSASTSVTVDDLTSGALVAVVWLETFHGTSKSWTVDQYETVLDWEKCPTQFMRNVVVDCETGETISTNDTTLDGQPYEVTGEVEQCQPATGGGAEPLPEFDVAPIVLCDTINSGEDVETQEFLRSYRVDNATGVITGYTDTALDGGTPYEPVGEVGQCNSGDTPTPEPEPRVDVETEILCVLDSDGGKVREVRVERVYDDQSGALTEQRIVDPTTGEPYTLADGETLGSCPECPVAFSTECVAVVDRSTVSYDNTAMVAGMPGQCGSIQGPVDTPGSGGSTFGCNGGPYRIISWVIDGVEVITGTPPTFPGGPCGTGDATTPGMHANWAAVLTNLDPHGAWIVDNQPGCAWFVRSDAPRPVEYGPMIVEGDGVNVQGGTWTLGPVQDCEETPYTKVYSQDCDGEITVSWLDAQGNPTDAPEGELVPCGTGCRSSSGGGCCDEPSQDIRCETFVLCDTGLDGDDPVSFMRAVCRDSTGVVVSVTDTELDAITPYTVRS